MPTPLDSRVFFHDSHSLPNHMEDLIITNHAFIIRAYNRNGVYLTVAKLVRKLVYTIQTQIGRKIIYHIDKSELKIELLGPYTAVKYLI
jgi:hypothetical protein